LEKIIAFFQLRHYQEIYSLSNDMITGLAGCPLLESVSPSRIRLEVWSDVLTWATTAPEDAFNKRYFVENMVKQLAEIFGMDYKSLYTYIVKDVTAKGYDFPDLRIASDLAKKTTGIADFMTKEYIQQLATVEKLLQEFQIILLSEKTISDLDGLTKELPIGIELIQSIRNLSDKLLKRTAKISRFLLRLSEPDTELRKKAGEFEEWMEELRLDLVTVLQQNTRKANDDIANKIGSLVTMIDELRKKALSSKKLPSMDTFSAPEEIFVKNAGIVLLWPYLFSFFESLGLVKGGRFINEDASERAALILHYLAFGSGAAPEYELMLNKILCGIRPGTPVKPYFEINGKEVAECENLLQAVIRNWPALKNVSVSGLRKMFLQREGMVFTRDGHRILRAAGQAYDILLDQMPWGIGTVKLPWMAELLLVEWRV
jgi:hypothetical protein